MSRPHPNQPNPAIQRLYRQAEEAWERQDYQQSINGPNSTQDFYISSLTISQVPEPSSLALMGLGIAGLAFLRRRK